MNSQITKRRNPFEKPLSSVIKEEENKTIVQDEPKNEVEPVTFVEEEAIEEVVTPIEPVYQPQPQQRPVQQPQYYEPQPQYYEPQPQTRQQPQQQRVVRRETKQYHEMQQVETREKFTSTMEQSLRRSIKVVCAQRGIMFAQFVEEACREKLKKEGFR